MENWRKLSGKYDESKDLTERELFSIFHRMMSTRCSKETTYKFALLKSLLETVFLSGADGKAYFRQVFKKFTAMYWPLVVEYKIKQIRGNRASSVSLVFAELIAEEENLQDLPSFEGLPEAKQWQVINSVIDKQKNVLGALLGDSEDILFNFDWKERTIELNPKVVEFMKMNYDTLTKLINYSWALWLAEENKEKPLAILSVLHGDVKRRGLDKYKNILYERFGENACFYCSKPIKGKKDAQVDHFIPWTFIQDDNLWNLVISCKHCNVDLKKVGIPSDSFVTKLKVRNLSIANKYTDLIHSDFKTYNEGFLDNVIDSAYRCGFKIWNPKSPYIQCKNIDG